MLLRKIVGPDLDVVELARVAANSEPTAPQPTTHTLTSTTPPAPSPAGSTAVCSGASTPTRSASRTSAPLMSSTSVGRRARRPRASRESGALPRFVARTFISQGSSCKLDPGRRGDALAFVDEAVHQMAEVPSSPSAAKCWSCGSPVSAATPLTVALKISFDHCAGSRSGSASAFRPASTSSAAIFWTRSKASRRTARARSACRGCTPRACRSASCRS